MSSKSTLVRAGTVVVYVVLGAAVTAGAALPLLYLIQPMQRVIYGLLYLQVGPGEATEAAILLHFLVASSVALALSLVAGDALSTGLENRTAIGAGVAGLAVLLVVFLVLSLFELAAFLTAVVVVGLGLVGIPVLLWFRFGVRSGGLQAFVGGVPVVVLLLLLAGFGLGWGWGYVMTAEKVPASSVDGAAASFDEEPEVARDLLEEGDCDAPDSARQTCFLELRGYEHELAAVRFMARHGVRCPYEGRGVDERSTFVARYEDSYYRVGCAPHGD